MRISGFRHLGFGDGRVCYEIDENWVVKIAYNAYGKKQNKKELKAFEKFGQTSEGQMWLGEISYGDENWLIMEKMSVMNDEELLDECQMEDWKELYRFLFSNEDVTECPAIRMIQWLVTVVKMDSYEIKSKNFGYSQDGEMKCLDYGL